MRVIHIICKNKVILRKFNPNHSTLQKLWKSNNELLWEKQELKSKNEIMKPTFDMQITISYPLFSQKQNKVNENQGTNNLYTPNANATLGAISKKASHNN